jgi:hypothetical protein
MKKRTWSVVASVAAFIGAATATAMTWTDYLFNPEGLFHGPAGTNWPVVWETWITWFLPTSGMVALLMIPMAVRRVRALRERAATEAQPMAELSEPAPDLQRARTKAQRSQHPS